MSGYTHILAAVDFSAFSEQVVDKATRLAALHGAKLSLLHVVEFFPEDIPLEWIAPENKDPALYLQARARDKLVDLARRVGVESFEVEVLLTTHSAGHEIARVADEQQADLMIIGSHGRGGFSPHTGPTAHAVLHRAHCDVLVVRVAA